MTDAELDEIERKANAAFHHDMRRWRVFRCGNQPGLDASLDVCGIKRGALRPNEQWEGTHGDVVGDTNRDECCHAMRHEEAEHIAASDPTAVRALIAEIRRLRAELADANAFAAETAGVGLERERAK